MIPGTATSTTATQRQENAARGNVITYHCIIGGGHCAPVCIVTKGSTSDSGRDPSFGGSPHTYIQAKTCRLAEHFDRIGTHFETVTLPQYPPVISHSSSMKRLSDSQTNMFVKMRWASFQKRGLTKRGPAANPLCMEGISVTYECISYIACVESFDATFPTRTLRSVQCVFST